MLRSLSPLLNLKPFFPLLYARPIATTAYHLTKMDPGNRERGLKAAINNPRVSEQAKQRDREILESEFGTHMPEGSSADIAEEEVLEDFSSSKLGSSSSTAKKGRSKSTGSHNASTGSKTESSTSANLEGKDRGNVIRGLKAAINNPNVSEKAKEKDRKKLQDLGESMD
ncbi:Conidiation protein 6-domain-containing protein [Neurospora hispaniola]|uniref:Conidiation protein 6-domain-containing protein n=1 Tax=Neurospora hispaniola TaxID=588809 RepID=A0AAJ0IFP8_9PEZI|nr:Conidiation protein 6-domain-containing protein [Neurospora hispaniola]